MKRFVIGDIHGSYKALAQVLGRSGFNYEDDLLITLGDIVDGWSDVYMVVEELLKIKNRIDIVGNHDDWFLEFIDFGIHPDGWSQGGLGTAKSYAKALGIDLKVQSNVKYGVRSARTTYMLNLISDDIPLTHQAFFKNQNRFYKDGDNNVFVHGGFERNLPLADTSREEMMWNRRLWDSALSAESGKSKLKIEEEIKNIFIGHTTTLIWGKTIPMKADIIYNVDTGAGEPNGKLTIMDIDTKEYWQSDLIGELYPNETNGRK